MTDSMRHLEDHALAHRALVEERDALRKDLITAQDDADAAHREGDRLRLQVHDLTERLREATERAMKAEVDARNALIERAVAHDFLRSLAAQLVDFGRQPTRVPTQLPQDEPKPNGGGVTRADAEKRLNELGRAGKAHEPGRDARLRRLADEAEEGTSGV